MIIDWLSLMDIREQNKDKIIGFASGSFDLSHAGHVLFFEDCKRLCDILVIMVGNDKVIKKLKGQDRPILNEQLRLKSIDAMKPVDYTFLDINEDATSLAIIGKVFKLLRPNRYFINPDAYDKDYRMKLCNNFKTELYLLDRECPERFEQVSTTKVIEKIKALI